MTFTHMLQSTLIELKLNRRLGVTAKQLGISGPRMSEFLKGTREITPYYLGLFIKEGIVTIDQLLNGTGKAWEELTETQRIVITKLAIDDGIAKKLTRIWGNPDARAMVESAIDLASKQLENNKLA